MTSTADNKQVVEQFFSCLSSGDVEGFVALYHPRGSLWTSGNTLMSGTYSRDQIAAFGGDIFDAFPQGLAFSIVGMTAEGDRVAVEAESKGEHSSGQLYHNFYHFLFEFRDGKVYRLKEYMDTEKVTDVLCGGQRPGQS